MSIFHFNIQEHVIQPKNVAIAGVRISALVPKVLECVAHVSIILHSVQKSSQLSHWNFSNKQNISLVVKYCCDIV